MKMKMKKLLIAAIAISGAGCTNTPNTDVANAKEQIDPFVFNIDKEKVIIVDGIQYTPINISWHKSQLKKRLYDAKVTAHHAQDGRPLSEVSGWAFMENLPKAVQLQNTQKGIFKSDREKTVYLLSTTQGELPVCLSVSGDSFNYNGCEQKQILAVNSSVPVKREVAKSVKSTEYVISSIAFNFKYNNIFANGKHQLEFTIDVRGTTCFDKETGNPQYGDQCLYSPELTDIPLSQDVLDRQFKFKKIITSTGGGYTGTELESFNPNYEKSGIYLKEEAELSNVQKQNNIKSDTIPKWEAKAKYTFYITADTPTSSTGEMLCVEIPQKRLSKNYFPAFAFSSCHSGNSQNIIIAVKNKEMPIIIDGQDGNTYRVNYDKTALDNTQCHSKAMEAYGYLLGFNFKQTNYPTNIPTEFLMNFSYPVDKLPGGNIRIRCTGSSSIELNRKNIVSVNAHLTRVFSKREHDGYNRDSTHSSILQISEIDNANPLYNDAIIYGSTEKNIVEHNKIHAAGAVKVSRDQLIQYTSLGGDSKWQTHLFTIRSLFDNNNYQDNFYMPTNEATSAGDLPGVNTHRYYIIDSFGNTSQSNFTISPGGNTLVDGQGNEISLNL